MNVMDGIRSSPNNHPMSRLLLDEPVPLKTFEDESGQRLTIRAASSDGRRNSAHILVRRMYATRGYQTAPQPERANPNRITFVAEDHDMAIGTITVGFDGADGLLVDESFEDEVQALREDGLVLCEFIKLAVDGIVRSKKVLASLMHAALIFARELHHCDKALIEVNPRHVRFYQSMLGFDVLVRGRYNHRVNAPAVLMSLDLAFAVEQVDEAHVSGAEMPQVKRSLYHHGFSREEMTGLIKRLRRSSG